MNNRRIDWITVAAVVFKAVIVIGVCVMAWIAADSMGGFR